METPCPSCGGTDFVPGRLMSYQGGPNYFEILVRGFAKKLAGEGKGDVAARLCRTCGRLDLFVPDFVP